MTNNTYVRLDKVEKIISRFSFLRRSNINDSIHKIPTINPIQEIDTMIEKEKNLRKLADIADNKSLSKMLSIKIDTLIQLKKRLTK